MSCSFVFKVNDGYSKINYLKNIKNALTSKPLFRRRWTFVSKLHLREKCPYSELNTERYSVSFRIQSKCGEMQTRITPNMGTFLSSVDFSEAITWNFWNLCHSGFEACLPLCVNMKEDESWTMDELILRIVFHFMLFQIGNFFNPCYFKFNVS